MAENQENNVLYVQMFGGFSLTWNEKRFLSNARTKESQFAYLMQLLLHHREKGVSRDVLEKALFEERDIQNVHHSMRSVIYNAKKKLERAGLPKINYIEQEEGVYRWTEEIPVVEDAEEFERLCREAAAEEDELKKAGQYLEACYLYEGEFLPFQASEVWVAQEAGRYRKQFCICVEETVKLLRSRQDFLKMEELGRYASKIQPLSDWETVTMEALIAQGQYWKAQKLYDDTVELYIREQGVRPSKKMKELLRKLDGRMEYQYAALEDIQRNLSEEREECAGAYLCSYPVFLGIYQVIRRVMERSGQTVYLMLCTIIDSKGNPMKEGALLEELSVRLEECICRTVRHSDVVNRYGKGQYLILLTNTTREDCGIIQKRINESFIVGRQRTGLRYYVSSVFWQAEEKKLPLPDREVKK